MTCLANLFTNRIPDHECLKIGCLATYCFVELPQTVCCLIYSQLNNTSYYQAWIIRVSPHLCCTKTVFFFKLNVQFSMSIGCFFNNEKFDTVAVNNNISLMM